MENYKYNFYIDRGGTFTDVYATWEAGSKSNHKIIKLLSVDPSNYADAPREAIRRVLYENHQLDFLNDTISKFPAECEHYQIESIRMGTTVATNALLERKGTKFALVITKGFADLVDIAYQDRPKIFDLNIIKPETLYQSVIEVEERIIPYEKSFKVLEQLNEDKLEQDLGKLLGQGIENLAVVLMHAYARPEHEQKIAKLAYRMGFKQVSLSSDITPMIKIVPRANITCIDAYLSPIIKEYISSFKNGFSDNLKNTRLLFMKSDAGLCDAINFRGANSILSGPSGGVVGYSNISENKNLIGFDMGGTSTDVSRFDGDYELNFESTINGVTIQSPQLAINTVAAGGSSRLFYKNGMFQVGPESSSAHPGPVCYRKNGYLSITDANLVLGRLVPEFFPKVFGPKADQELDKAAAIKAFQELQKEINQDLLSKNQKELSIEEIAYGFIQVANETMARPIREISVMKGYDAKDHTLVCFGGAGAQHACAIARDLGIKEIYIHKYSGILSAYGIGLADELTEKQKPVNLILNSENKNIINKNFKQLIQELDDSKNYSINKYLNLRYEGTNTTFMILEETSKDYKTRFIEKYKQEFGFNLENRNIIIDDIRIRAINKNSKLDNKERLKTNPRLNFIKEQNIYFGKWLTAPVYLFEDISPKDSIKGPAIIMQNTSTIIVEPDSIAKINQACDLVIELDYSKKNITNIELDPINLAIFSNRFMSIAEQMGKALERTAISTNIKERRDFSCAIFDAEGNLIANAPHQPVHLGSMGHAVKCQIQNFKPGVTILSNHPMMGGSHLPDMTVISPVYDSNNSVLFFVANRAHHADIGGISPGSMPSFSTSLEQEGIAIKSFNLVEHGDFQESKLRELFASARAIEDNISDLKAQIAANQKGIELIQDLISNYSLETVLAYMQHIQNNAENSVRDLIHVIARSEVMKQSSLEANDHLDDGSEIKLKITLDAKNGSASFDFSGSAGQLNSNLNCPEAVTSSAVLYALRALINKEIPLNQGCLKPITIIIPENSLLKPSEKAAVVGGNVQTSQRIVDVILKAFNACAASQGCMNNVIFGNDNFGYYETIGGGAGAGPSWHGASGVHTHMTNTRITDPEILETRYPVILREFSLRKNSGGDGKYHGGDGLIREFEFLTELTLSLLTERRVYAPYGMAGGSPGAKGENIFISKNDSVKSLAPKTELKVSSGDRLKILTPGGGGWGSKNPLEN